MLSFVLRRFASLVATLVVASAVVFTAMEVLPGDPAQVMLGTQAQPDTLAALRTKLGLDKPAPERYVAWVGGLVRGDLGTSYTYSTPVSELVGERLQVSLPLALLALSLTILVAIPVGALAAARRNSMTDLSIMGVTQVGIAVPNFWFAMLLVILFAITLRWLPAGGFPGWGNGPWPALRGLILPAVALALPQASILARVMRSSLLDTLGEDYVRTARAKGLSEGQALRRHALRNALIPVLTIVGLQFSFLIAGTIVIENVFYLPGIGRLVFQAINQRDLIVVKSVVMLLVASVIVVNFLVDIAYAIVDPRLRRRG
ncbi:ABC transporter permease [uncultured Alsobacter sp.]|uniref:ABC transporter permease n=1 Tax=uncultured Alsobacter sp. TaxID=1748258 RepID=UPI0025E7D0FF|nr:ABC transporter permease [uncultured Alsobacter sp.]